MKVSDLKANAAVDEIVLKMTEVMEPRDVRGGQLKVANASGTDDTGSVTLTLWNEDADKVKTGDTIKIVKGWVGEYQGRLQVSAGKFGELTVVESAGAEEKAEEPKPNKDIDFAVDEDII